VPATAPTREDKRQEAEIKASAKMIVAIVSMPIQPVNPISLFLERETWNERLLHKVRSTFIFLKKMKSFSNPVGHK
jgi:hypothetical protein